MLNTTTDLFADKQAQIALRRKELCAQYPSLWSALISAWRADDIKDAAWLTYSANYLLRTGGTRWAIDPLALYWRVPEAPRVDVENDLDGLSFVLLTHDHRDHLDLNLIRLLREKPIHWVIPSFLQEKVIAETGLAVEKIITPRVMNPIQLDGVTILPFEGQHIITYANGSCKGIPELGYLAECNGKRWLFPGDTRVYDISRFPKFGVVDLLFAHLWLGHGSAQVRTNGYMDAFCQFVADLRPKKAAITHLQEFARDANNYIDDEHAQTALEMLKERYPEIDCFTAHTGEMVDLS
jgi:L-ascorbate metabolism protein UlaG (beta-lactamase superfamily)